MIYIRLFLPAILSLVAFLMMLRYGLHKGALFIAALCAMAVYVFAESRAAFVSVVNGTALTFVLVFALIRMIEVFKKRRGEKNDD